MRINPALKIIAVKTVKSPRWRICAKAVTASPALSFLTRTTAYGAIMDRSGPAQAQRGPWASPVAHALSRARVISPVEVQTLRRDTDSFAVLHGTKQRVSFGSALSCNHAGERGPGFVAVCFVLASEEVAGGVALSVEGCDLTQWDTAACLILCTA